MKYCIKKIFCILFVFSSFAANAQKEIFSIHFKNGKFVSGSKIDAYRFDKRKIEKALFNDQYFVVVQFSSMPTKKKSPRFTGKWDCIASIYFRQCISGIPE